MKPQLFVVGEGNVYSAYKGRDRIEKIKTEEPLSVAHIDSFRQTPVAFVESLWGKTMPVPLVPPPLKKRLTFDEFKELPFKYKTGVRYEKSAHRAYRNDEYGLQKELITRFNSKTNEWKEGKLYYFIDGDPNEYTDINLFYGAYLYKHDADEARKALRCADLLQKPSE